MAHWQPTATLETLRYRAKILAQIRQFFEVRDVLEVDVPVLSETGVTDLHIDCLQTQVGGAIQYLQSSPEYFMKRLLASGSGSIYSLGKAFRDGERGRRHHPEFTMLEWYRTSWDECQLVEEVTLLLRELGLGCDTETLMYGDVFGRVIGLNPHTVPLAQLQQKASSIAGDDFSNESRSTCLDLIFSLSVEPALPNGLVFIRNYPACQAALARLDKDPMGNIIARRFEAFLNGVELANGYYELIDPVEQKSRFDADLALRQAEGKPAMSVDTRLLAAMDSGLPSCAGVALGVDRLLMQLLDIDDISHVMPFGHVGNNCE
ncbi:MAG: EF-P lysine aminoacylase GenX [Porticoccus sp.]|nr:EF-P lysine aminoacylase GenX [Porticoccus sp.]MBQ0807965.1 EF-P lysine aminoacylase GenX [Porticoccus sp.]